MQRCGQRKTSGEGAAEAPQGPTPMTAEELDAAVSDTDDGGDEDVPPLVPLPAPVSAEDVQMEGNPVWSNPDYSSHLVSSLPSLSTLDQQDVTPEMKGSAKR